MQRVVLDQLQPGSLGILGSIDLDVGLTLAVECLGFRRRPVTEPRATGGRKSGKSPRPARHSREHHPRLAIIRRPSQMFAQDRLGLAIPLALHPVRDRVQIGQRTGIAPVPPRVETRQARDHAQADQIP